MAESRPDDEPASKLPWMPFWGDDFFLSDTVRRMPRETKCIYLELLWHAWNAGGIPADSEERAYVVGMTEDAFEPHWKRMAKAWRCHWQNPTLLVNEKQETLRSEKDRLRDKRRQAGRKGALMRWRQNGDDS